MYEVESEVFEDLSPISFYFKEGNRLNYAFSASSAIPSASTGLTYLDNWTVINNPTGDFNGFAYSFALTPNMIINYTASITATNNNGSDVNFDFGLWGNEYVGNEIYYTPIKVTSSITMSASTTQTFTLTGSYQFIGTTNYQYHLETANLTAPISLSNTFWIITQSKLDYTLSSVPQVATNSIVIIEPYLLSNFKNSDCDVLMNNASQNDISGLYRRVLYDGPSGSLANLIGTLNSTLYLTGVQIELGNAATPFEKRNYGYELSLCQRYYQISEVRVGAYHTTGLYIRGSAYLNTTMRAIASPVLTVLSTDESSNLGSLSPDTSNFRGDSFRYLVQVTTTGDAYGQWKVSCDAEF